MRNDFFTKMKEVLLNWQVLLFLSFFVLWFLCIFLGRPLIESMYYKFQSVDSLNSLMWKGGIYSAEHFIEIFTKISLSFCWFAYLFCIVGGFLIKKIIISLKMVTKQMLVKIAAFFFLVFIGSIFLLWLALYNGYPLVFPDSAGYISCLRSDIRPSGYNILILLANLIHRSAWTVVFSQSFFTSLLIMRISYILLPTKKTLLSFVILTLLVVFTDVSKYTSWIMADIFTSWLFLGGLLFFASSRWHDRLVASTAIAVSFFTHSSHVAIAFLAAILLFAIGLIFSIKTSMLRFSNITKKISFLILVCSFSLCFLSLALTGEFRLLPKKSTSFIVNSFAYSGLLAKTLEEQCRTKGWKHCNFTKQIKTNAQKYCDWYLWSPDSFRQKEGFTEKEEREIIFYVVKDHFKNVLKNAFLKSYNLLTQLDIYNGLDKSPPHSLVPMVFESIYPKEFSAFTNSRQQRGVLLKVKILPLGYKSTLLGFLILAFLATGIFIMKKEFSFICLIVSPLLFILLNAISFWASCLLARYNTRVLWLLPYCLFLALATYLMNIIYKKAGRREVRSVMRRSLPPAR